MDIQALIDTAKALMNPGKGLLAMDESIPTCNKRFEEFNIPLTAEYRRLYRELIVTAPGLGDYISGAILFDETVRQLSSDGRPLIDMLSKEGIIPGIKVDEGAVWLGGSTDEKITEGLDGLRQRNLEYYALGARFAKWRAVIQIGPDTPSLACLISNTNVLARYAAICQETGLLPIVEPEVIMEGDHSLARSEQVTEAVIRALFDQLYINKVDLRALLLKPNMILSGYKATDQANIQQVADTTVQCFLRVVPAAVPGIAFLSGGQSAELATERLNAMHTRYSKVMPWALTFSFSRALQQPALAIWKGQAENIAASQRALVHRAKCNSAASLGRYTQDLEVAF